MDKKKIALYSAVAVIVLVLGAPIAYFMFFKGEEAPDDQETEENQDVASDNEEVEELEDILVTYGLPSVEDIKNTPEILEDYTTYLETVAPLYNGLSVGFSVMYAVFTDTTAFENADGIKADFATAETEYRDIFARLKTAEVTANTRPLNQLLTKEYEELYDLRSAEAQALYNNGDMVEVDYNKVPMGRDDINTKYLNIVAIQRALTEATGVYLGDGMDLQEHSGVEMTEEEVLEDEALAEEATSTEEIIVE